MRDLRAYLSVKRDSRKAGEGLGTRQGGTGQKGIVLQQEERSTLGRRKKFFVIKVMRCWCRLPREVDAPCINSFRKRGLDTKALLV